MPQLRIGFLAHDWSRVEPWVHRLVAQTISEADMDVSTLINAPKLAKTSNANWLYRLVVPFERKIFAKPVAADQTQVQMLRDRNGVISWTDETSVSALELDVIFCVDPDLASAELAGRVLHGIWYLNVTEGKTIRAVSGKEAVASIDLNRIVGTSTAVQNVARATINPKFILSRNKLFMKEKAVVLILRELRRLAQSNTVSMSVDLVEDEDTGPGTAAVLGYFGNITTQFVKKGIATLKRRTGVRPDKFILLTGTGNALNFDPKTATEIAPEGNNFWADPFLWERDGRTYCFYEHYSRATKVGHIQVGEFHGDKMTVLGDALKTDIHLSFPYLFEHEGELYMMPETCAAKRIEIWRCVDFPLKWELHSTALEGQSVADSMILRRDGKWWLFTNIANDIYTDNCSELHIFQIDGPDMKCVEAHAANPVVMDSRTARNAGRFHEIDGKLYRPSQDNAYGQYGYGLNIMKVEELSRNSYRESLVRRIDPHFDANIAGCHHFDARGERFIMDALKTNSKS